MGASWTIPKDWTTDEVLTAVNFNTHVRDNLKALKDPPTDSFVANEGTDWTTTSTSFVDIDATDLSLTITTNGGAVMVGFYGSLTTPAGAGYLDVDVDGTRWAGDDGLIRATANQSSAVCFVILVTGLSAASHTFKLQWKAGSSATLTLYAGAGTAAQDTHPQFWVREVS
jgi:hypothetical protein